MTEQCCKIKFLNTFYDIKCPEGEEENLSQAVDKLQDLVMKQKSKFKNIDDFKALFLAALSLSHDMLSRQQEQEQQRTQVNQLIASLEDKIQQVIENAPAN